MAERLTIKNSDNTYSQPTDTTFEMVFNKLGKLEDILEKYSIESVEELEKKLADSDTWQKACELACDVILRFTVILRFIDGCPCKADYFYQQAKTEGNDDK